MTDNANERICETCVYCSFGGYCDERGKHLASIEQPACDKYERHPLLVEVEQLKALCNQMRTCEVALARLVDVAAKADIDSCAEILECVEVIRKAVER